MIIIQLQIMLTCNLFAEMDSSNANISLYSALWLGQTLDLDLLSPCVLNFANRLVTVQFYTWVQTLFVIVLVALTYYYVVLPMDYVKVSHFSRIACMWPFHSCYCK